MKKRLLCLLLAAALSLALPAAALAEYDYSTVPTPKMIVTDGNDPSQVFYERAADERAYPASTTKIMTCILTLESGEDLDTQVTVGEEVKKGFTEHSSLMGLEIGETVSLRDLLYGLMLVSGNDAAAAIAVHLAGSIEAFADRMNSKAAELGMTSTHFVNPHGVHNDDHYTTARDMARLTAYALKNEQFRSIVSTGSYTVDASNLRATPLTLENTNKLIHTLATDTESCLYEYAIGVKTGDTTMAGKCLVAAAEKDGATVIIVLFGDANDAQYTRFHAAAGIFESVFTEKYTVLSGADLQLQTEFAVSIAGARQEDLNADGQYVLTADVSQLQLRALPAVAAQYKANAGNIVAEVEWRDALSAPISAGETLGTVRYMLNGECIYSIPLTTTSDILEAAIVQPDATDGPGNTGDSSLLTPPSQDGAPAGQNGPGFLVYLLIALVVLLVILIVALAIVRARRRAAARRRRQRRLEQQRRMQAQQRGGEYPPRQRR